jgi:putative transposase
MVFGRSGHGVFSLRFDLVLPFHSRLGAGLQSRLEEILKTLASSAGCKVLRYDAAPYHVRLRLAPHPSLRLSTFINSLKGASSRRLRQEFPAQFRDRPLWDQRYCLVTVEDDSDGVIRRFLRRDPE